MKFSELDEFLSRHADAQIPWNDGAVVMELIGQDGATVAEMGIRYAPERDELHLYSPIAWMDDADLNEAAPLFLEANRRGLAARGFAAFAYDDDEQAVVLWDGMKLAEITLDDFIMRYYRFYQALVCWWVTLLADGDDLYTPEKRNAGAMLWN